MVKVVMEINGEAKTGIEITRLVTKKLNYFNGLWNHRPFFIFLELKKFVPNRELHHLILSGFNARVIVDIGKA